MFAKIIKGRKINKQSLIKGKGNNLIVINIKILILAN